MNDGKDVMARLLGLPKSGLEDKQSKYAKSGYHFEIFVEADNIDEALRRLREETDGNDVGDHVFIQSVNQGSMDRRSWIAREARETTQAAKPETKRIPAMGEETSEE